MKQHSEIAGRICSIGPLIVFFTLLSTQAAQLPPTTSPEPKKPMLGDFSDGSRAHPVHLIPLRTAEGDILLPEVKPAPPLSTRTTCGECHDYEVIRKGWHFNSTEAESPGGRKGQPWILTDAQIATQLPLSYRRWSGAYYPQDIGISRWQFARIFSGRTAGGISADSDPRKDDVAARWDVSGDLEVNCLSCHDAGPAYDHAEWATQILRENFRWAATAGSGLATVTGSASAMPPTYDYLLRSVEDGLQDKQPKTTYMENRFWAGNKIAFDLVRTVPAKRCYFCHSNADTAHLGAERWKADEDIHMSRGFTCVDCHRNGLDHRITRGYEEEASKIGDSSVAALSCKGCHAGAAETETSSVPNAGRMTAPRPRHKGFPAVHFTKLHCTACHSGPWPAPQVRFQKSSQTHFLGMRNVNKAPTALPHIAYPVFVEDENGRIAPNKLIWPSFWGWEANGKVTPFLPDAVRQKAGKLIESWKFSAQGDWPDLTTPQIVSLLNALAKNEPAAGRPVYVGGGKLHAMNPQKNGLIEAEHDAGKPYTWPLAHEVRPASQALGVRGCEDCHSTRENFFFGKVAVDSLIPAERGQVWGMESFQGSLDQAHVRAFSESFVYRPWMKAGVLIAVALLFGFFVFYGLCGLGRLSKALAFEKEPE